jgi:hypothetical protein
LISFPRGTEMCQFSRLPSTGYVFTGERRRITGVGFPHSEIRGSKAVQRLTAAYRSRPRPSSAPGAKASTMCPYSLDGELDPRSRARIGRIPLLNLAFVQFSSSAEAGKRGAPARGLSKLSSAPKRRHRARGSAATSARSGRRSGSAPEPPWTGGAIGASP